MKFFKKLFIVSVVSLFGCGDYLDINSDPSFPQEAPAEVLLPPIFQEMVRGELFDSRYFGMYVQNWTRTSSNYFWDIHGYLAGSDAAGEKWRQHYWAIGKNIDLIVEDAVANSKWHYAGAALAIRAWSWQTSTDVYGEMILKQAWEPNRYVFDYDSQEEIYAEVRRLCNEALSYLDKDDKTETLAIGDIVYDGDVAKWKKFVNAILARNAHHISNKTSYNPDDVIAFVDKSFGSSVDNFNVPHAASSSSDANFLGPLRSNLGVYRQTEFAINLVNGVIFGGVIDPRREKMFAQSLDGAYRGNVPGSGNGAYTGNQAIPEFYGKYIYQNNADYPVITFSELQFIKAEAAFKKGDLPVAYSAFLSGISSHMDFAGVSAADRDAYLASVAVPQVSGDLKLSDIMLQKYIAMHGHGILETWVDMRRHEYSNAVYLTITFPNPLWSDNDGNLAYRARPRYNSEYVWNVAALELIGATSLDYHTKKPWFVLP